MEEHDPSAAEATVLNALSEGTWLCPYHTKERVKINSINGRTFLHFTIVLVG
jgi:hypothetical protein